LYAIETDGKITVGKDLEGNGITYLKVSLSEKMLSEKSIASV
jgi:hypothetical protein